VKVTFFGASHGVPEPNRKCSCIMLEAAGRYYLVDIGADPVPELIDRGLSPNDITAVFVTHPHGDHVNGLVPFADICSWYFKDADPLIFLPDMRTLEALKGWIGTTCGGLRGSLRCAPVREGEIYDDGAVKVTALPTGHMENAYAFLIEAEGKTALFTGDMKHKDGPLADFARFLTKDGIDLAVAEGAHFDVMQYLEPLRAHPPKLFCINHYNRSQTAACWQLKRALEPDIPTVIATDGLEIRI
jgi:Predicted exonuclease of the beta-lactamase fold involved in RNA processing